MTSILLFLKAPMLGFVKTRLAVTVGDETALEIYRTLVERQIKALDKIGDLQIHFTPTHAEQNIRNWVGNSASYFPQTEGDLSNRLSTAVTTAFKQTPKHVICIGGDCPQLSSQHIHTTQELLNESADLVFGPTEDGGYYLVGMKAPHTAIFEAIPWSSNDTLKASLNKAKDLGLKVELLETLYDVDTEVEFNRAQDEGLI